MKFAGSESLPRVEHFACGGFPSGMEHFHIRWIPFPAGVFCMRQVYLLPAGAFRMRQVYRLPAGAFCMRQLRGGEASILHHIPIIMTHLIIFTNTLLPKTQGTGPLRGPLSRPPSSIGSAWRPRYCRIHRPTKNVTHTTTYAPKKRAQKGGARGGNTRASQLRALSPSQISAGKQFPDFPRCITAIRLHSYIKA